MANFPTSLLAIVLGYRLGGVDGACVGAGIGWVAALALSAAFARPVAHRMGGYEKLALRLLNEVQVISQNVHRGFTSLNGYSAGQDALWHDIRKILERQPGITPHNIDEAELSVLWRFKLDGYLPTCDQELLNVRGEYMSACR